MTAWPLTPVALGGGDGLLDQRRDVEALGGRAPDEDRVAAEAPVGVGDARDLGHVVGPRRHGRAAGGVVEERQGVGAVADHGDAERLEQLDRGGTSRSDLTPDEATRAGMRAAAARSAETSGGVGKPRWTPPRPPVPMNRIPTAAAAVERAADRGRADRALHGADGEVARPELAGGGSEPLEL